MKYKSLIISYLFGVILGVCLVVSFIWATGYCNAEQHIPWLYDRGFELKWVRDFGPDSGFHIPLPPEVSPTQDNISWDSVPKTNCPEFVDINGSGNIVTPYDTIGWQYILNSRLVEPEIDSVGRIVEVWEPKEPHMIINCECDTAFIYYGFHNKVRYRLTNCRDTAFGLELINDSIYEYDSIIEICDSVKEEP